MSWLVKTKLVALAIAIFFPVSANALVYVYEVATGDTRFQTVSKLPPDAYLYYNGGEDIIRSVKVLKIYADKDFNKALRDYGLEDKNIRHLPSTNAPGNYKRYPYYWWR